MIEAELVTTGLPSDITIDLGDVMKGLAKPNDAEANHTRIEAQDSSKLGLNRSRGVESHDEIMSSVVRGLMDPFRSREEEGSPVGEAADDSAGL